MSTRLLSVSTQERGDDKTAAILEVLTRDGLIAFPTDTFYGIGGNCFSRKVIKRIYRLKRREKAKPLLVVVSDLEMIGRIASDIPPVLTEVASDIWPGPLTVALKASAEVPLELLGESSSIAVRLPDFPWLQELVRRAGFPLIATSANPSGGKAASTAAEVLASFSGKLDLIVDGGPTGGGLPSTVLDLTSRPPKILREGAVPRERLARFLK